MRFRRSSRALPVLSLLVCLALLVSACQPIQPEAGSVPAPVTTEAPSAVLPTPTPKPEEAAPAADAIAGAWTGSIAIAGVELAIDVTFSPADEGYTAAMDIPQQGAAGLPVHSIVVDLPSVAFAILEGQQQATFDGTLAEDDATGATISGAFLQAGQEGTFTLTRAETATEAESGESATGTGIDQTFTDAAGFFSVPVPTNWTVDEQPGHVTLRDPDGEITVYLLAIPSDDPQAAIATAWETVRPGFDLEVRETLEPPSTRGIERTVANDYRTGDDNLFVQAIGQLYDGVSYVQLYDVPLVAAQRRSAQLQIISSGFRILAQEEVNLSDRDMGPLTDALAAEWEESIERMRVALEIPGAVVGVVRGGELVYAQGFGYADPETETPLTPQTHMMIGSTGKSLTTLMMATLVDDGLMAWDTPAQELFPSFAVKDPELSETITMRNLVCACTGVPRRDFEFIFNASELDAADTVASLADFEFFTDFGEAFQYSNQMVATGGFIAGYVAEPEAATLEEAYSTALAERVTGPIGMQNTTLSFEEVLARGQYATPHGATLEGRYEPISLDVERVLIPIGPSGAHWSTLEDMADYMILQLAAGLAPDGTRVVSEENLLVTRQPQVNISAEASYGLGWMVGDFRGLPMVEHGGNTMGFTSDFGFLPTADLGVIVLANAQGANLLGMNARVRLIELLYGLESEVEPDFAFTMQMLEDARAQNAERLSGTLDVAAVEPFAGDYHNTALGSVTLALEEGRLLMDAGEFQTELRPWNDEEGQPDGFVTADPPVAGLLVHLEEGDDGTRTIILGEGLTEYVFLATDGQ